MTTSESQTCTIDDVGPMPVAFPKSAAEVGELVLQAAAENGAIFPVGGRTMLAFGNTPTKYGTIVDLRELTQIIDYPARDMTITVEAGITLAKLHAILTAEKQRLPVDVPQPEVATLGGAMAVNASGPRRLGFGTLRDYVIGITTINDEGRETKAGGRVVKNVAGYDICKLHIGALGTLGIITQVTLKLRPIPEESALVIVRCKPSNLPELLDKLHASRTRPVCVDVLNERSATEFPHTSPSAWLVLIGYEDSGASVRWQLEQIIRELQPSGRQGLDAIVGPATEPVWAFLRDFPTRGDAKLTLKANLLPHAVADFCSRADQLDPSIRLLAHAGSGIVIGHIGGDLTAERAADILRTLHQLAGSAQGDVVVQYCPAAWKASLPIWGLPRSDARLMQTVREKLDPRGIFNPGRFLSGEPGA